jgi:hypothetical protein
MCWPLRRAAERESVNRGAATKGFGAQNAMTMPISQDALRNHDQRPCWSPQIGAPNAADLVVISIFLNPDGSVAQAPQLTADNLVDAVASNAYTRRRGGAAKRAIYRMRAVQAARDRLYATWREIVHVSLRSAPDDGSVALRECHETIGIAFAALLAMILRLAAPAVAALRWM